LLVVEVRVEDVKFIPLNGLGRRVVFRIVLTVVLIPLHSHSLPVDVLRFAVSEPPLSFARNPIIEFLFVFLHSLVLFELDNFLGDVVIGSGGLGDDCCAEEVVVFGKR
jgi:hypothetical protein